MKSILDIIKPIRLTVGHSSDPSKGSCVMDVVSYINGDRDVTDHPECACPVITAFAIRINDRLADADRQKLLGYVTRIAGSRAGRDITVQRALMCANFAKRQAAIADFVKCYAAADRATLASLVDRFADAGSAAADTADYSAARLGDADVAKHFAAEAADYAADADECAEFAKESKHFAARANTAYNAAVRYADGAVRSVDADCAAVYAVNAAEKAASAAGYAYDAADAAYDAADAADNAAGAADDVADAADDAAGCANAAADSAVRAADSAIMYATEYPADADAAAEAAAKAAKHAAIAVDAAAGRSPADVHYVAAVMAHLEDMLQLTDDAPVDAPMIARAEQLVLVNASKVTA